MITALRVIGWIIFAVGFAVAMAGDGYDNKLVRVGGLILAVVGIVITSSSNLVRSIMEIRARKKQIDRNKPL